MKSTLAFLNIATLIIVALGFWRMESHYAIEKKPKADFLQEQNIIQKKDTFVLSENNFHFKQLIDSLFKTKASSVKIPTLNFQPKMNSSVTTGQINVDSLKMEVANLALLVKTLATKPIKIELPKAEQPKAERSEKTVKHPYYTDVDIIFRTRNSYIIGKIKPQYKMELAYGQLFRFENALPDYLFEFTDKKGNSITQESAKDFLIKKSFFLNSVELKDNNTVVNCSQGI